MPKMEVIAYDHPSAIIIPTTFNSYASSLPSINADYLCLLPI